MRFRIFALAFSAGFIICFSAAAVFILCFSGENIKEPSPAETAEQGFPAAENAVFLLVYEDEGSCGPFCLAGFDAKKGRIPVFAFSGKTLMNYGGEEIPAERVFSSVSPELFAGKLEAELGIRISGYFIWNREGAEEIIAKTGTFGFFLPEDIIYSKEKSSVCLLSGNQSMSGKKICDILGFPGYSEEERAEIFAKMAEAFFGRRLKRFLPGSRVYSVLFNYTRTDLSAFGRENCERLAELLAAFGSGITVHIPNISEKDSATGFLRLSEKTRSLIKENFGE